MAVNITATLVNELRTKSGAGMMDCKRALVESEGDLDKAMDILRKKGAATAAKRAGRDANEGVILTKVSDNRLEGAMVEVNCETDFVAKSDDFLSFVGVVLEKAFASKVNGAEEFLVRNEEIPALVNDVVGKVGEKTAVSRVAFDIVESGYIAEYVHPGNKVGALVKFVNLDAAKHEFFAPLARNIAVQVAAMKPLSVSRADVPAEIVAKEVEIYRDQAKNEGKPENILERIATGRLEKFYKEVCLMEQDYFKDMSNARTIAQLVLEFNKEYEASVELKSFALFLLGGAK